MGKVIEDRGDGGGSRTMQKAGLRGDESIERAGGGYHMRMSGLVGLVQSVDGMEMD